LAALFTIIRPAQSRHPAQVVEQSIAALLSPASATEALDTYWLMQIPGNPDEVRAALLKVAAMGIPLPIQP
jgi:hypothetical protein